MFKNLLRIVCSYVDCLYHERKKNSTDKLCGKVSYFWCDNIEKRQSTGAERTGPVPADLGLRSLHHPVKKLLEPTSWDHGMRLKMIKCSKSLQKTDW